MPFALLDVLTFASPMVDPNQIRCPMLNLMDSRDVEKIVQKLQVALQNGVERRVVQLIPHLVLLSRKFYYQEVMPLLAQYAVIWLSMLRKTGLKDEQTYRYLMAPRLVGQTARDKMLSALGVNPDFLDDEFMKLLNLAHDQLHSILPFVLGKVNRVTFGLLSPEEIELAFKRDPKMPRSRTMTAVPFVGKDVPSQRSEFAHPDIVIGLTILAFRYEGFRGSDLLTLLKDLQENLRNEEGPYQKRPAARMFAEWVKWAGGRVRGSLREEKQRKQQQSSLPKSDSLIGFGGNAGKNRSTLVLIVSSSQEN